MEVRIGAVGSGYRCVVNGIAYDVCRDAHRAITVRFYRGVTVAGAAVRAASGPKASVVTIMAKMRLAAMLIPLFVRSGRPFWPTASLCWYAQTDGQHKDSVLGAADKSLTNG